MLEWPLIIATLIMLSISHWLIWNKLQKIESRLETMEADSLFKQNIIDDLQASERAYAEAILNTSARVY